jgi:hypothetical protein
MSKSIKLKCPYCGGEVDVENILVQQFEQKFKEKAEKASLLKLREREKVISDLRKQLSIAMRKAEQGSQQNQGSVQETEIVATLSQLYPYDEITQSTTGTNAADIKQVVRLQNGNVCGVLYVESKRTQNWVAEWTSKLRFDNLNTKTNADILVIITNTLPASIEHYGMIDGVWVTNFEFYRELILVLRFSLIKLHSVSISEKERESIQAKLFAYFTSNEFKNVFEAILEGFKKIQDSHQSEKLKVMRMWKEREQIFEKILLNSIELYGSLQGIGGSAIPEVKMFQLPEKN